MSMVQVQPVQTSSNGKRLGFAHNTAMGLGITQIVIGLVCQIPGIVTIIEKCALYQSGTPIWCGAFFIITGILGCVSSCKKTNGYIIASLVLSIISSSLGFIIMIWVNSVSIEIHYMCTMAIYQVNSGMNCTLYNLHTTVCTDTGIVLLVLTVIELVIAIISSGFGCRAICCHRSSAQMYFLVGESGSVPQEVPMEVIPQTDSLPDNDLHEENYNDTKTNIDEQDNTEQRLHVVLPDESHTIQDEKTLQGEDESTENHIFPR